MVGVRVRLGDVFTVHIDGLEGAIERCLEHVRNTQARLGLNFHAPRLAEQRTNGRVRHVAVAREFVRERAHVAGALHVVLATQRVHAHAFAADVAGGHREVRNAHDHRAALAMLGNPQPVVDGAAATGSVEARSLAHTLGRHAGDSFHRFRRVALLGDERAPTAERARLATLSHEGFVDEAFGDDHMRQRVDERHVRARHHRQMHVCFDVRRAHQFGSARVRNNQLRALTHAALQLRAEHRVRFGGVGTDDEDDVRLHDAVERLRAGRLTERVLQAIARGRMADAGAGVDVVVAESRTHQLLDEVDLFVGATRGRDGADRFAAELRLDALHFAGCVVQGFVPAHFTPSVMDAGANHRVADAVRVGGVAPGETALHAGMAVVGVAITVRHHADDGVVLGFGLQRATHAAIGASGRDSARRLPHHLQRLLGERARRAAFHASAARDALGIDEGFVLAGNDLRAETAALHRQRKRALHFVTSAHAAAAGDAERRVEVEVRVAGVADVVAVGRRQVLARGGSGTGAGCRSDGVRRNGKFCHRTCGVTHFFKTHGLGGVLQFAVAVGHARSAIQRMLGDVQLNHALADALEAVGLRTHLHALGNLHGAGSGQVLAAFHLNEAQAAGAEGLEGIGGAELGHIAAREGGGAHDGGAGRNRYRTTIDLEIDGSAAGLGRAEVVVINAVHRGNPPGNAEAGYARGTASCRPSRTKSRIASCRAVQ